jgi:DNA-directed RNA polymerase specialized sigma24 family protein
MVPKPNLEIEKMNENTNNGTPWPDEVRQKVGDAYEPTLRWLRKSKKISLERGQDVVHEVLQHIRNGLASKIENWPHYLGSAAWNQYQRSRAKPKIKCFSELTDEEREELYAIKAPGRSPDEEAAFRELVAIMLEEIKKLPRRQREVLTLELAGKSPQEIQAILGIKTLKTVYANRQKAVANIRKNPAFREED